MKRYLVVTALVVVVCLVAWTRLRKHESSPDATASSASAEAPSPSLGRSTSARTYPHATRDQAKRDELRTRILAAAAEAETKAKAEAEAAKAAGQAAPSRGQRATDDVAEFGMFVGQAIREDFLPMARSCAKELLARKPNTSGSSKIAFELLGDSKIGGVVNSTEVVRDESTIHDAAFETCVKESLYGVYFDPPPSSGRATLNFDVKILEDGGLEDVPEFSNIRDRRNEK